MKYNQIPISTQRSPRYKGHGEGIERSNFKQKLGDRYSQIPTVSLVRFLPDTVRIYYQESFPGQILEEAGLRRPDSQDKAKFAKPIGLENIGEVDADFVFYFVSFPNKTEPNLSKWFEHPLWKNLEAAKSDRVYRVSSVFWNDASGIQAANRMLDDLERYILPGETEK